MDLSKKFWMYVFFVGPVLIITVILFVPGFFDPTHHTAMLVAIGMRLWLCWLAAVVTFRILEGGLNGGIIAAAAATVGWCFIGLMLWLMDQAITS